MAVAQRFLVLALAGVLTGTAAAQQPVELRSVMLDWVNLRVVVAPDSEGTWLWFHSGQVGKPGGRSFSSTFAPGDLSAWLPQARQFLKLPLTDADSGDSKSSLGVGSTDGERLYLFRHRLGGQWSEERFIIIQPRDTTPPFAVNGTDETIGAILDSLESVSTRTPRPAKAPVPPAGAPDKHARSSSTNKPPPYPRGARDRDLDGLVVLAFVVGVGGKADLSSVVVLQSTHKDFTTAVLRHLPLLTFEPAMKNGAPVRERVTMPFNFSLYRGRPR